MVKKQLDNDETFLCCWYHTYVGPATISLKLSFFPILGAGICNKYASIYLLLSRSHQE